MAVMAICLVPRCTGYQDWCYYSPTVRCMCPFFFIDRGSLNFRGAVAEQGRGDLRSHCRFYRSWRHFCPAQYVYILGPGPSGIWLGFQSSEGGACACCSNHGATLSLKQEDPKNTSYFSHIFFVDHIVSTIWTVFFATLWWFHTPHDGRHIINSDAQQDIIRVAHTSGTAMTDEERVRAATTIWNAEKGVTLAIIVLSWLSKV